MQAKVVVVGTLKFPPEKVKQMLPHVKNLLDASRIEKGCIAYDAAMDIYEPGVIRISEFWTDQEQLDLHVKTPHVEVWFSSLVDSGLIESEYVVCDIAGLRVV